MSEDTETIEPVTEPVYTCYGADGSVTTEPMPPETVQRIEQEQKFERESERRIAEAKARKKPKVEPVEIEGETWFPARLNWHELAEVSVLSPRDANGDLNTLDRSVLEGYCAALFFVGLRESAEPDALRFFESYQQAFEYSQNEEIAFSVLQLFNNLCELNPALTAKKK